jgi:solute carrier family 50 protein (sugar transporter)
MMFGAPIADLRRALIKGSLGPLNPLPFSMMTGNCIGWCAYAYYTHDPFVLAANLPGLLISLWLNFGAIKLQYLDTFEINKRREDQESPVEIETLTMVPQETTVLRVMLVWSFVLLWVGWLHPTSNPAKIVGLVVNTNLIFFYASPLKTIMQVVQTRCSDSIHVPTMVLNWTNTSFWLAYGAAQKDFYIMIPNACGLTLGLTQGVLCLIYPKSGREHLSQHEDDEPMEVNDRDEERTRDSLVV